MVKRAMAKTLSLFLVALLMWMFFPAPGWALDLSCASAVLFDGVSLQILYSENAHERRPPASTTKVVTALLALKRGHLSDEVEISAQAAATGGSSIYLEKGESLTLEELLWGLLLQSGNDAAVAIAEHIAGSVEAFAEEMNQLANTLGALNSSFKNPHGLPQEGHLSTAYDLARITLYALEHPLFCAMVETENHHISWPQEKGDRFLTNSNRLLSLYPLADGVKTGWTQAAGRCLISSATKGERRLIAVTLDSPNLYQDAITLLEYGFNHTSTQRLIARGEHLSGVMLPDYPWQEVALVTGANLYHTFSQGRSYSMKQVIRWRKDLTLPLDKNQPVAWLEIFISGEVQGKVPLLVGEEVKKPPFWRVLWERIRQLIPFFLVLGKTDGS